MKVGSTLAGGWLVFSHPGGNVLQECGLRYQETEGRQGAGEGAGLEKKGEFKLREGVQNQPFSNMGYSDTHDTYIHT